MSKSKLRSKILNLRKKNSNKKLSLNPDRIYQFLKKNIINFKNVNWLGGDINPYELDCSAKIRSTQQDLPGILNIENHKGTFSFYSKIDNTSPGQACVFYKKDNFGYKVLGGGWITN